MTAGRALPSSTRTVSTSDVPRDDDSPRGRFAHRAPSRAIASSTLSFSVLVVLEAFALGARHGFDPDHLAAISELTASQRGGPVQSATATPAQPGAIG